MRELIILDKLVKTYVLGDYEIHALRGIDLIIKEGEFVAIMGPSGSGKSTLMNILGCLDRPTSGRYVLDSLDVSSLNRDQLAEIRNKKLGFVFQSFNLLSRTSAIENVELPLLYNGNSTKDKYQKAMKALEMVGLRDRANAVPNQLSGGQQQRVAIARALINEPAIILADEPTGNLDTRTSIEVMDILQMLNNNGITIVLITHEPDIASYAGRNILFRDGKIVRDEMVASPRRAKAELANLPAEIEET
ncbi:MAG: ABC transporter ATP-binding protein [candidate division Zixibacteria bacterium]|jgi:putative ABC transport system ATP-binding protein|nr:ABC transporter ATP-binding protein [candidate division Zixibacteria bacterium]